LVLGADDDLWQAGQQEVAASLPEGTTRTANRQHTMNERQAFIRAILEDPDDDLHRLVCADWLDEHGDPDRADFIRAQVELARLDRRDPRRGPLETRAQQLLHRHGPRWLAAIQPDAWGLPPFERGFPRELALISQTQAEDFIERADAVFAVEPIIELGIAYGPQRAEAEQLVRLAGVRQLEWLRRLSLNGSTEQASSDPGLEVLLASPYLLRLRTLHVDTFPLGMARAMSRSPMLASLHTLDFDGVTIDSRSLEALLNLPLARVEVLLLAGQHNRPCIGEAGVIRLARWPGLARVEVLDLRWNQVGERGVDALVHSPHLEGVRLLRLFEATFTTPPFWEQGMPYELTPSFTPAALAALHGRFGDRVRVAS
jgi:uncharacterized protein (TIGR02996 family)